MNEGKRWFGDPVGVFCLQVFSFSGVPFLFQKRRYWMFIFEVMSKYAFRSMLEMFIPASTLFSNMNECFVVLRT